MLRRTAVVAALLTSALAVFAPTLSEAAPTSALSTWTEAHLALPNTAVAVDTTRGQLLVGVDARVPTIGNHLVEIDLVTGELGRDLLLRVAPTTIAVSDDGSRAYVGYGPAKPVITEIDLATFTVAREFGVGAGQSVGGIYVQPGHPDVIAVNRGRSVAIVDDGVLRPDSFSATLFGGIFGFRTTDEVVGKDGILSNIWRGAVDAQGVHQIGVSSSGLAVFGRPDIDGSLLTFPNGRVYDIDSAALVGTYPRTGDLAVDHDHDLAYFFSGGILTRHNQSSYAEVDRRTVELTGSVRVLDAGTEMVLANTDEIVLLGPNVTGADFILPAPPPSIVRDDLAPTVATVAANALVADPDGRHVWVTTTAADSQPGSLVEVDARTGQRTRHLTLTGGPETVAISDDGSTLFVGYDARDVVTEIAADDLSTVREVSLPDIRSNSSRASAVTPVPGLTDRYLVVLSNVATSETATVLVDSGAVLPSQLESGGHPFFLDEPTTAYAVEDNTGFGLLTTQLDATGLVATARGGQVATSFVQHVSTHDGLAYTSGGDVFDPLEGQREGHMGQGQWEVLVPEQDRVLYVRHRAVDEFLLSEHSSVATHDPALDADDPLGATRAGNRVAVLTRTPATLTFIPLTTPPDPPRLLHADPETGAVELTWKAPLDDGGPAISSYRVYRDGVAAGETADGATHRLLVTGQTDGQAHTYTVTAINAVGEGGASPSVAGTSGGVDVVDPTITFVTPTDGATFDHHESMPADYTCADPGSGIASCVGDVADGTPIDTSRLGEHTFTVTADDNSGNRTESTVTYTVEDVTDPTVTFTSPLPWPPYGAFRGQRLEAHYSCADEAGGSGLASCTGTVADGARLNTRTNGVHSYSVTAVDVAGNSRTFVRRYRISQPRCAGRLVTVILEIGQRPTNRADVIQGRFDGNDFNALGGDDLVCASSAPGMDRVYGGAGNDHILLNSGNDRGYGGDGNDVIEGGDGFDTIEGGAGNDRLIGGGNQDTCRGGPGRDTASTCEVRATIP